MLVSIIHVYVKPEFIELFKEATRHNHENSIKEHGILRFDILQDELDESKFILYEVYDSAGAIDAHKQTAHYFKWRDTVARWMDKPREPRKFNLLHPADLKK